MNIPTRDFEAGNYYHIYNRGNNRQRIFVEKENYHFFLKQLRSYLGTSIHLVCYCLLPNHYHLLIYIEKETNMSNIFGSFLTSYVKSFNRWIDRTGHLFEGPFQSKRISSDDYLIHVCRYIHLNPVTGNLVHSPEMWEYSDYLTWISEKSDEWTESLRQDLIGTGEDYRRFVMDFHEAKSKEIDIEKLLFGL